MPFPSTTTVPSPETLAVLNIVAGLDEEAAEPDGWDVVVGVWEPPPQPARTADTTTASAVAVTSLWG